jgi:hypothetical protein
VVQLDLAKLTSDISSGAPQSTIDQDRQTLNTDFAALALAEQKFAEDSSQDQPAKDEGASSGGSESARNSGFADLASLDMTGSGRDQPVAARPASGARHTATRQDNIDQLFAAGWDSDQ